MLPYLSLGHFVLQTSGLSVLLGVWVGFWLSEKKAARLNINPDLISSLIFVGLIGGLLGARLVYAASFLNAYLASPLSLFSLNLSTLSPPGGLFCGVLTALIYGQRKRLPLRLTLDILTPGLAAFMIFGGLSHFLSGDAYGAPSRLPWAIELWNDYRHPSQLYEMLLAAGVLFIVLKYPLEKHGRGLTFLQWAALSAAATVFLEAFRGDSVIWPGGFRSAQVIGLAVLLGSLLWMRAWAQPAAGPAQPDSTARAIDP